jgi:heat shock protein HtpX
MLMHMIWWGGREEDEAPNPLFIVLGIAAAILAPIIAMFVQLAISRQREYLADGTSAMTTRYPDGLIRALKKIEKYGSATRRQNGSTAHLFFANPLKGNVIGRLLGTHPPIEDRIARLQQMGQQL